MQWLAVHAEEERDGVAALLQPHALGRPDVEENGLQCATFAGAVLQRGLGRGREDCFGGQGVGVERLAEHQQRLAMHVRGRGAFGHLYVGGKRHVAGDLLPYEVKVVLVRPKVIAGRADGIYAGCGIERCRSGRRHGAYIGLALKDAQRTAGGLRGSDS